MLNYTRLNQHYREVFKEEITPLVLDIEEEPKDQDHVHHGDHDDNNHAAVQGHGGQDHTFSQTGQNCLSREWPAWRPLFGDFSLGIRFW